VRTTTRELSTRVRVLLLCGSGHGGHGREVGVCRGEWAEASVCFKHEAEKKNQSTLNADSSPIHACAIVGLLQIVHVAQVELISLRHRVATCVAGYDVSDTRVIGQRTRVAHHRREGLVVSCHDSLSATTTQTHSDMHGRLAEYLPRTFNCLAQSHLAPCTKEA
jgi:hypothetical protein